MLLQKLPCTDDIPWSATHDNDMDGVGLLFFAPFGYSTQWLHYTDAAGIHTPSSDTSTPMRRGCSSAPLTSLAKSHLWLLVRVLALCLAHVSVPTLLCREVVLGLPLCLVHIACTLALWPCPCRAYSICPGSIACPVTPLQWWYWDPLLDTVSTLPWRIKQRIGAQNWVSLRLYIIAYSILIRNFRNKQTQVYVCMYTHT